MERTTTKQTDMKFAKCINKGAGEYLTIGKIYPVKRVVNQTNSKWLKAFGEQTFIEVTNDRGMDLLFNITIEDSKFIDIEEERNNKLNQLGI